MIEKDRLDIAERYRTREDLFSRIAYAVPIDDHARLGEDHGYEMDQIADGDEERANDGVGGEYVKRAERLLRVRDDPQEKDSGYADHERVEDLKDRGEHKVWLEPAHGSLLRAIDRTYTSVL